MQNLKKVAVGSYLEIEKRTEEGERNVAVLILFLFTNFDQGKEEQLRVSMI